MDITIATEVAAVLAPALPYLLKGTGEATQASVGGRRMPETVVARPYSGLQPSLCRQLLWPSGGS